MKTSESAPHVGRRGGSTDGAGSRNSRNLSKSVDTRGGGNGGSNGNSNGDGAGQTQKKGANWSYKPPTKKRKPRPYRGSATGKYDRPGGGRFSMSAPKSYIDWEVYRAKQTPGPNRYSLPDPKPTGGVAKISDANPKSELDWIILRASKTPGPSQYEPRLVEPKRGVQFSDANPKSYLDWAVYNAKSVPGPGSYDITNCPYPVIAKSKD